MSMKHYHKIIGITFFLCLTFPVFAQFAQPFKWEASSDGKKITVTVEIPPKHYLYADSRTEITITAPNGGIKPDSSPVFVKHTDEFGSGDIIPSGKQNWTYSIIPEKRYEIAVKFQGCKEKTEASPAICFMPSEESFSIDAKLQVKHSTLEPDAKMEEHVSSVNKEKISLDDKTKIQKLKFKFDDSILDQFSVIKTGGGYLNTDEFLIFLGVYDAENKGDFADHGTIVILLLVLLGGLALNLTPCVLPMIPINLAIIGAGMPNDKKSRGFLRGAVYGIGIAVSYGILGLITVLSGAKFGTLNSTPWFNFIIAVIFVLLALAMFDIFSIDFTRFTTGFRIKNSEKGALIPVPIMGVVAALLAGACVAPVVIAVLLYSTSLYAEGNIAGLILPFVLGIGMAFPWPFAGAGIALMPKPGKWMVRVKQLLGGMILLFAAYYTYLGIILIPRDNAKEAETSFAKLENALLQAQAEKKPVFIDFWASWCKNCTQMERTTFKDPKVIKKLDSFIVVKFQAEKPNQPNVKKIMDRYKLIGLPGYVILKPK